MREWPTASSDWPSNGLRDFFDDPPGKALVIGCNEEYNCEALVLHGFDVTGTDFRPIDREPKGFTFVQGDFTKPEETPFENGTFDTVVAISAIEHFGLGFYKESSNSIGDMLAQDRVYDLLKPGGHYWCSVPTGVWKQTGHWRRYDEKHLIECIIRNFKHSRHWVIGDPCLMNMPEFVGATAGHGYSLLLPEHAWKDPCDGGVLWETLFCLVKP